MMDWVMVLKYNSNHNQKKRNEKKARLMCVMSLFDCNYTWMDNETREKKNDDNGDNENVVVVNDAMMAKTISTWVCREYKPINRRNNNDTKPKLNEWE